MQEGEEHHGYLQLLLSSSSSDVEDPMYADVEDPMDDPMDPKLWLWCDGVCMLCWWAACDATPAAASCVLLDAWMLASCLGAKNWIL